MVKQATNTLLVPWDFTEVSQHALDYAVEIARQQSMDIDIIHIVPVKTSHEDFINKEIEIRQIAEIRSFEHKVTIRGKILSGSIFETIAEYAKQINAWMVVMGTHGMQGIQRYSGSLAYKVLFGSEVPFIIVKTSPRRTPLFKRIVLPIDSQEDNIELIEIAVKLGNAFQPKFYILKEHIDKKNKKSVNTNAALFDKLLAKKGLDHEIFEAPSNNRFEKEIISFAHKVEADLIVIRTIDRDWADRLFGNHEQNIIDNTVKIPVMCVKPLDSLNL